MSTILGLTVGVPFSNGQSWNSYWMTRKPSGLILTVLSDTSIKVDWTDAASAADGLKVYFNDVLKATINYGVQTATITGLIANTLYNVELVAYKGVNESDALTDFEVTTIELSSVANRIFNYDSDHVTLAGEVVDVAEDLSTVTGDVQAPGASNRPALVANSLNGRPAISFDGSTDRLIKTGTEHAQPYTVYTIATFEEINADSAVVGGTTSTYSVPVSLVTTKIGIYAGTSLRTLDQVLNTPLIMRSIVNGDSSNFRMGDSEISGNAGANSLKGMELGGYANADAQCAKCLFYATFGYSGVHDAATQSAISRALCVKYGVTDRQKFDGIFHNSVQYDDKTTYKIRSAHSEYRFKYSGTTFSIKAKGTLAGADPTLSYISVFVNGVYNQRVQFLTTDTAFKEITVPAGVKEIALVESLASRQGDAGDVLGCFITDIIAEETFKKMPVVNVAEKLVFLGDSITVGSVADNASSEGYPNLFKVENAKEIGVLGWGYGKVASFAVDAGTITATVGWITTMFANVTTNKRLIIALGTNDYGIDATEAATIKTMYGNLLDAINLSGSDIEIYCVSPLKRLNNPALLAAYRTAISELCAERDYTTYINGYDILELTDMADNVHPTTAGHKKMKDALYTVIYP